MGLYINMEMPEDSDMIVIYSDGTTRKYLSHTKVIIDEAKAIPVQPHGRLIDADALWVEINKICDRRDAGIITDLVCLQQILSALRHAPTIIPAEEDKT